MKAKLLFYGDSSIEIEYQEGDESNDLSAGNGGASVSSDASALDVTDVGDSSDSAASDSDVGEGAGLVSETVVSRPLLTTPFDDYTVTEGLLLISVVMLAGSVLISIFRRR